MKRVFTHIGFSMATALIVLNLVSVDVAFIISIGLAVVLIASLLVPKFRQAMAVPLCLGSALFACLVFMCNYSFVVSPQLELNDQKLQAEFYYVDMPEHTVSGYVYTVETVKLENENAPQNIKLRLVSDNPLKAEPYDILKSELYLYSSSDNAFDSYGNWAKNVFLSAKVKEVTPTNETASSPFKWLFALRRSIISTLYSNMDSAEGGLAVALVTGYKGLISEELYNSFKLAGTTHLIAVSGFHLTVVTTGLFFVLKLLKINDKLSSAIGILFILCCIGVAGFSKTVIRAGIMMIVMLIARAVNKRCDSLNSLGLAVGIISLNPFSVADIGAQLSVISVLAMILVYPHLPFKKCSKLISFVSVPAIVMLATLPIMYIFFGYISLSGLLANVVVTPLGSVALVLSMLSYLSIQLGIFPKLVVDLTIAVLKLLISVVEWFSSLSLSVIRLSDMFAVVLSSIFVMLAIAFILGKTHWIKPFAVISCVIISAFIGLEVYNSSHATTMLVTRNSVVVCDNDGADIYGLYNKNEFYEIKSYLFTKGIECEYAENEIIGSDDVRVHGLDTPSSITVNEVVISFGFDDDSNIIIDNNCIYDNYGLINRSKGDIIYTIYDDSTYKAVWVDGFGG